MATNRFLFKDKIVCRLTRKSNAETQLLGYIAWQWYRYLVPQNVFLVFTRESSYCFHRVLAIAILSVCPSVRPSHGWISQKRCEL